MKTKLQALISEQKALTTRFEELEKKITRKPYAFIGNSKHWENIRKYLDPKGNDNLYRFKDDTSLYLNIDDVIICDYASDKFRLLVSQTHTIIDLNEQPDFFEKLSNSDNSNNLNPQKIYIKGHTTRGAEVIKMLEDLGGINISNLKGNSEDVKYYILTNNIIIGVVDDCSNEVKEELTDYTELHLPKEEVELIEGEVYVMGNCIGIFKERISNNHTKWYCVLESTVLKSYEVSYGQCLNATLPSSEQRKQLFDAIEKANKHFDKETMRLLDVEKWSCEKGLPIIVRNKITNWRVDIFHSYDSVDTKYPYCCNSNDECDRLYRYAMPYTKENLYFVGTTINSDKQYKFVHNDD